MTPSPSSSGPTAVGGRAGNPLLAPENLIEPERRWFDIMGTDVSLLLAELRDGIQYVTLEREMGALDAGIVALRMQYSQPDLDTASASWFLWLETCCEGVYRRVDGADAEATKDTPTRADRATPGRVLVQATFPMHEIVAASRIHRNAMHVAGRVACGLTYGPVSVEEKKDDTPSEEAPRPESSSSPVSV